MLSKKQILIASIIAVLLFVILFFVYPSYIKKTDINKHIRHAKKDTEVIVNFARRTIEQNNFDNYFETYSTILTTKNINYLFILDKSEKKLFQINDSDPVLFTPESLIDDNISLKDSTLHLSFPIFTKSDSLLGMIQIGFDVFEVYNNYQKNQIQAIVFIIISIFISIIFLVHSNGKSNKNMNNSLSISDINTNDDIQNQSKEENVALSAKIDFLSEQIFTQLGDLKEFIGKNEKQGNHDINNEKVRQEFGFIRRLYKLSNIYSKIEGHKTLLDRICIDVCEEFMYDLGLLYMVENDNLIMYDSYFRDKPSLTEKFLKEFKNKIVDKNENLYQIIKEKDPIFTRNLPSYEILNEKQFEGHYVILPISNNGVIWAVLFIGLFGNEMPMESRDVEKLILYSNSVGTLLETVKNFEKLGSTLKSKTRELVKANTLLRRSVREKDEFLRAISHDLIAPLRNISGLLNSIERKYNENLDEGLTDRLFRIKRNVEKDMELVNEILEISRVKSRKLVVEKVDLNKLILSIFESFNHELQEKKIKVKIQEKFPIIYFDRFIMNQILQNLIDNAIKYIKPESEVRDIDLNWRYSNKKIAFAIGDTGIGIPPEDLDKIFSIFFRSINEMNVESDGKGVGLAMIKSLLEKFNGEIWVKSKVNVGSIFYFTFPNSILYPPEIKSHKII